jgi:hypothetical protein
MQLHFTDAQLKSDNFLKNTVKVKYWDNSSNSWLTVNNAMVNTSGNTVTFSQNTVSSFVILTADQSATGVEQISGKVPTSYALDQNYPNPFNPTTSIVYQIPRSGLVTLKVYDILGKQVAELVNENQEAGKYSVNFSGSNLPSGIYIYELKANDYLQSRKMVLLK